jgi:hypothetical protein
METFVSYLIRSLLISGLMLGYYHTVLRNRKLHSFNRVWLLTALLASLVLPLVRVGWLTWHSSARQSLIVISTHPHPAGAQPFQLMTIVLLAGTVVSTLLLAILILRILRVYNLKRGHRTRDLEGCTLIEVRDHRAPFSFMKNLFWQEDADIHDPVCRKILDHELAHIRGGHTYDNLFAQTLAAIFWINPFYWLIRRELQMVHEFIADASSIATGDTETFALILLQSYDNGRYLDPSHHFFHSPIKRRLFMISSSKTPSGLRAVLALPLLLGVMALACSKEQSTPAQQTKIKQLNFKMLKLKLRKDSIDVRIAGQLNKELIFYLAQKGGTDSFRLNVQEDPLRQKSAWDRVVEIEPQPKTGSGDIEYGPSDVKVVQESPPPPPKKN